MRYILLFGVVYALLVLEAVLLRVVRVDLLAPGLAQAVVVYVALSRRGSAPATRCSRSPSALWTC